MDRFGHFVIRYSNFFRISIFDIRILHDYDLLFTHPSKIGVSIYYNLLLHHFVDNATDVFDIAFHHITRP
jgi:hypothetical protein